jgi:hypothetical protein
MAGATRGLDEYLDLAVRAYTLRADRQGSEDDSDRPPSGGGGPRVPKNLLIFDTETTTDRSQRLLFGCWRYVRVQDGGGPELRLHTVEEGLFFPDDLAGWYPEGMSALEEYAGRWREADVDAARDAVRRLKLVPLSSFLAGQLWRASYELRAGVVCFNWSFDISRLAWHAGTAVNRFPERPDPIEGGFSLALWKQPKVAEPIRSQYRPDIGVKTIDSKRALKAFRSPARVDPENLLAPRAEEDEPERFRGHFVDLRTLAFALTDRSHSLESASEAFDVPYEKRKVDHGTITPEYIEYCREDVAATSNLCEATLREFLRHPIKLQASRAYSPATIGKSYLRGMGIRPPAQQKIDPMIFGHAMSAYYGGRAECRIRRTAVPIVYCDFLSMYPTVCALIGAWELLRSERFDVDTESRDEVAELLERSSVEAWLEPRLWPRVLGVAQIKPDGDVLPVRARYGSGPSWQIGVNPLTSSEPMWFPIADLVASTILTGRAPRILRAARLRPGAPRRDLVPTALMGQVEVDPLAQDFFQAVVEERKRSEREGAGPRAAGLKVLANATSYGIYAQMTRRELGGRRKEELMVFSDRDEPWSWYSPAPEDPGDFCFPPLAASITGGARLMLGILERLVTDRGGTYAFCDTDSMAIVASERGGQVAGQPIRALSWSEVKEIQERFESLKPYSEEAAPGPLLELEDENFDEKTGKRREQLWCYSLSAKRYVLFNHRSGTPRLRTFTAPDDPAGSEDSDEPESADRKASQHGLGHLMNPIDPESDDRDWIAEGWRYLLEKDMGRDVPEPDWFDNSALAQSTISTPRLRKLFETVNEGRSYNEQVKPFNFMLVAFVPPIERPVDEQRMVLVAPYERDPKRWKELPWINRFSGRQYRITTTPSGGAVTPGLVCVKTYRDVFDEYLAHVEAKSAGPDGGPCRPGTAGVLKRKHVHVRTITHIGKESNQLEDIEVGLVEDLEEVQSEYDDYYTQIFVPLVLPALKELGVRETARRTGLAVGAVSAVMSEKSRPRTRSMEAYEEVAAAYASESLAAAGIRPGERPTDRLAQVKALRSAT